MISSSVSIGSQSVEARIASRLADIKRAYASKVDNQNAPVPVKIDTTSNNTSNAIAPPVVQAVQPLWGGFALGGSTSTSNQGSSVSQHSLNKACEFETFMYDPAKLYEKNPYKRPQHVNSRQWLQVNLKCICYKFSIMIVYYRLK